MKAIRVLVFTVLVLGMVFATNVFSQGSDDAKGEELVDEFLKEKGILTEKGTEEYMQLMKGILLGDYPELTGDGLEYAVSQEDLDAILKYATEQMSPLFVGYPIEAETQEALPESDNSDNQNPSESTLAYNRTNAINYATTWWNGQNSSYPDFGSNDCTNFISQAMKAGGFSMYGTGDGCRDENTQTEWYVKSKNPPIWCLGSNRKWEWSTAWSVVYDFRRYFTYHNNYASALGWTTSASTAKSLLAPGDIVQLQMLSGGTWVSYHNMLVTVENNSDLLMTYHSTDTLNKRLSLIPTGTTQRYFLIRFP